MDIPYVSQGFMHQHLLNKELEKTLTGLGHNPPKYEVDTYYIYLTHPITKVPLFVVSLLSPGKPDIQYWLKHTAQEDCEIATPLLLEEKSISNPSELKQALKQARKNPKLVKTSLVPYEQCVADLNRSELEGFGDK